MENDCFFNVRRKIGREGGSIANGWRIVIWPDVFIEAEHHAVWQSPTGTLVDVSTPPVPARRTLFVGDDSKVYDEETHRRLDNVRQAIVNDRIIQEFIDTAAEKFNFIEQNSVGQTGQIEMPPEYVEIENRSKIAYTKVLHRYIRLSDLCPCGSNRKVKRCHGVDSIKEDCTRLLARTWGWNRIASSVPPAAGQRDQTARGIEA